RTEVIVSETRPVPLWQHVIVGAELLDLFVDEHGEAVVSHGPDTRADRQVNPEIERITSFSLPVAARTGGARGRGYRGRKGTRGRHRPRGAGRRGGRHGGSSHGGARPSGAPRGGAGAGARPMRRPEVVELLDDAALLPAIMFIFSRAGCEGAVQQCSWARL